MIREWLKIIAAAAAIAAAADVPAGAADIKAVCSVISDEVASYARNNGLERVVVADFSASADAENYEAGYISEMIGSRLAAGGRPEVLDREFVKSLMAAAGSSRHSVVSAHTQKARSELLSVDAVVAGTVFGEADKIRVLVRLVDARKGRVLFSTDAELRRELPGDAARRPAGDGVYSLTKELPGVLLPYLPQERPAAEVRSPPDIRDAVAGASDMSCEGREYSLARRNVTLVDAKARYWAAKMKAPGGIPPGTRPGSEITGMAAKASFYRLLAGYYKDKTGAPQAPDQARKVEELMEDEERFLSDCGVRRR
jgi:TolB-like protein